MAGTADVSNWLKCGFELYKNNFVLLFVSTLLALLLSFCTIGILAGPLFVGLSTILLRLVDRTEPAPAIEMVFKRFDSFLQSFLFLLTWVVLFSVVSYILGAIPWLGNVLVFVAQSLFAGIGAFGIFLIAERNTEFIDAWKTSIPVVRDNAAALILLFLITNLINTLGLLFFVIGAFITAPWGYAATVCAYRQFFPSPQAQPQAEVSA